MSNAAWHSSDHAKLSTDLFCQAMKRPGKFSKIADELAIIAGKSKELLYLLTTGWCVPV